MHLGASETSEAEPASGASTPKKRTRSGAQGASEAVSEQSAFRQTRAWGA